MSSTALPSPRLTRQRTFLVAVAGNPNCGKTTLFNALTGLRHKVGNYPGVTVEKREGAMTGRPSTLLLDLPGAYSLSPHSPDEEVARDVLLGRIRDTRRPDAILIVIDASNLERNLFLATQIIEMGLPAVIACNMMDVLREAGHTLDLEKLSARLGVPVVGTVGARGEGIAELREALHRLEHSESPASAARPWHASEQLELELRELRDLLVTHQATPPSAAEGLAALVLADGFGTHRDLPLPVLDHLQVVRQRLLHDHRLDIARELTVARYTWLGEVVNDCFCRSCERRASATDRIDRVLTHRWWGLLIFGPMMALLLFSIFVLADPLMGSIEAGMGWVRSLVTGVMRPGVLRDLITDGMLAGVGNVVVFFPQICILFLFIALLEDTGYMARAAFLMNRIMSRVGLHGKSFIPLLSGHACAVPAIMATRTIENPRDRLATILVTPLMGCSARLPVYTVLIAACLPGNATVKAIVLITMYGLGVLAALTMASVFKRTLLRGPAPAFMIELPPYRWPQIGNVITVMWDRSKLFLTRAGTIILAMTIVLWALMNFPKNAERAAWFDAQRATAAASNTPDAEETIAALDHRQSTEQLENSIVGRMGRAIEPVLKPLGYDWKIGISIIASLAAREVFVGTMGVVYSVGEADEESKPLREQIREARRLDGSRVFTPLVAVGLMIFYVLACQCVSTLAVVRRETASWRWPLFMFTYMSMLAYTAALVVYQVGSALHIGTG